MKLLVIVLCLLSERFLIHSISFQRFSWFIGYTNWIKQMDSKNLYFSNPWLYFSAILLPMVIITSLIYILLYKQLFGFMGLILNIAIFYYCLGPENPFYPNIASEELSEGQRTENYFAKVNTELFALIFWYVIAGPIIALTYRIITLCQGVETVSAQAKQLKDLVEWLPARITAILYLLVGNFHRGFASFVSLMVAKPEDNSKLLGQCGVSAAKASDKDDVTMIVAEELVEYATIVLLVLIALFTLGAIL